jgi:hypothetical protein
MAPKITEHIVQNMKKEGLLKVSAKDFNDKNARATLNLKFNGVLEKRARNLVDILPASLIRFLR